MTTSPSPSPSARPPHDTDTEAAFIGGCLAFPNRIPDYIGALTPDDFYTPRHTAIWAAISDLHHTGQKIDPVTILDILRRTETTVDAADITELIVTGLPPLPEHVAIILRHRLGRQMQTVLTSALSDLPQGDPPALLDQIAADLATLDSPLTIGGPCAMTLDDIIATADDVAPWVIPGLIRQDWRVMFVGAEGRGKSTISRQIAACAAQGVHPFRFTRIPPVRALVIDAENPSAAIAETGSWIVSQLRRDLGDTYDPQRLHILMRRGLNIRSRRDRADIETELARWRPQLLVIGPLYQCFSRRDGESHEDATEPVLRILDDWRTRWQCALVIEHHAPQGSAGMREMRPYGSSLFLRWPEIGIGLKPDGDHGDLWVGRWRGDRLENNWPDKLIRGQIWPWVGRWDEPC